MLDFQASDCESSKVQYSIDYIVRFFAVGISYATSCNRLELYSKCIQFCAVYWFVWSQISII